MEHYEQYELWDWSYWVEYYCEVADKAVKLGFSEKQVEMSIDYIMNHYHNGLSVDEVVYIEFLSK